VVCGVVEGGSDALAHPIHSLEVVDPTFHGVHVVAHRRLDDERCGQDAAADGDDDQEDHELALAVAGVAALAEEGAEIAPDPGDVSRCRVHVVHLRERVPPREGGVRERASTPEDGPGLDGDREARPEDREDDHHVAELEHRLKRLLIDGRSRDAGGVVGDRDDRAEHDDDDEVAPRESGGAHDSAHPVHEVTHAADVLGFRPRLPTSPCVEAGDGEVEEEDHEENESGHAGPFDRDRANDPAKCRFMTGKYITKVPLCQQ
jgi:hypothetical protein